LLSIVLVLFAPHFICPLSHSIPLSYIKLFGFVVSWKIYDDTSCEHRLRVGRITYNNILNEHAYITYIIVRAYSSIYYSSRRSLPDDGDAQVRRTVFFASFQGRWRLAVWYTHVEVSLSPRTYLGRSSRRYMDRIGLGPRLDDPHTIILAGHCHVCTIILLNWTVVPSPGLIWHSGRAATSPLRHGPLPSPTWQTAPVRCQSPVGGTISVVFDHRIYGVGAQRKIRFVGASTDYYITVANDRCQSHPIRLSSSSGLFRKTTLTVLSPSQ